MLLAWLAGAFIAGIAGSLYVSSAVGMAGVVGVLLAGVAAPAFRTARPVFGCAALAAGLGMVMGWLARQPVPPCEALTYALARESPSAIVATVSRGPEAGVGGGGGERARLVLELESVDSMPAAGRVALVVRQGWSDVLPGDRLRFSARLREPTDLANPGLPDGRLRTRAAGIQAVASVASPARFTVDAGAGHSGLGMRRAAAAARQAMRAAITARVPGRSGDFLRTAVLGDRGGIDDVVEAGFRAAGATHVLSVSGLHLAAVAALFFFSIRRGLGWVPRLPLHVNVAAGAAALAIPAVAFYTMLTGEAVATVRSALMASVALVALIVGRAASAPSTLAAAALCLLAASPLVLFDVSFQLSFASVAGIALLARFSGRAPAGRRASVAGKVVRWLARFGAATAAATVATAPLVAHHFGEIAPAAPLGNLALVPLVELLVVPLGLAGSALAALWPSAGAPLLTAAGWAAGAALAIAEAFRGAAPVWLVRFPNILETAAFTACGASLLSAVGTTRPWRARWLVLAGTAFAIAAGSLLIRDLARQWSRDLRITFLDVGQGDAALVEAPGGRTLLIDGGGTLDGSFDPGERVVEPFLRARGITRLDMVALSHPHPDHMNGLHRVFERFAVDELWTSGDDGRNPEYGKLVENASSRGTRRPVPAAIRWGDVIIEPLGPWLGDEIGPPPGTSVNDASLVLRVSYAGRTVLFTGDLEADGEAELVGRAAAGGSAAADVLKVPHHGSRTSSTTELVDVVMPRLAVISLGHRNRFGFPHPEVLRRYDERTVPVLRTDRDGAVTVVVGADGALDATCARRCR